MGNKLYTNQDLADEMGLTLDQFIDYVREPGLIDENGRPTDFAIENGFILGCSPNDQGSKRYDK